MNNAIYAKWKSGYCDLVHSVGSIGQKVHTGPSFVFLLQPWNLPHYCMKMQNEVLRRQYFRLFEIAFLK